MHSIRRSCQLAFSAPKAYAPLANVSRRAFSQTGVCHRGSLPLFLDASTPELGALLHEVNAKVLLPIHLTKDQAKLVFKKENKARLDAEPMEITLGDVTLRLQHIDRNRDQPPRMKTFREAVAQSKTPNDFENLIRLIEGYYDASIHLTTKSQAFVIKHLGRAGMDHLVLKALQRANKTGIRLTNEDVVDQVCINLHQKAIKSKWAEKETVKALRLSEQIVELMDDKEHLGRKPLAAGDLRASPFLIAVPLELAAVRAKKYTDGQDKDGKVLKYASRLMSALHQDKFDTAVLPKMIRKLNALPPSRTASGKNKAIGEFKSNMRLMTPLWNALKTSRQVLGADMPAAEAAQKMEKDVHVGLTKALQVLDDIVKEGFKKPGNIALENHAEEIQLCEEA